ncbi:uncharacterized protein RCO7_11513 [Rhynchosporium graminicola]|uniref:Uncharacterized protein n=1 Tax=Rhynchosporium graminicola TaxID=2792576 RepID=A0A1E1LTF0_9HELO|nr:uncharacterized protein RCO7_11513 [Rhynchosporium commune]
MSDEEMDREWKPSNRPQSTMAKSFSLALNDLFKMDNSIADLDAAVSEKKKAVDTQTSELEALEARLKATEERLKLATGSSPSSRISGRSSPRPRVPLGDTFKDNPATPLSPDFKKEGGGAYIKPVGGDLPPTPGPSEGDYDSEYVFVERRRSADRREDGDVPQQQK